MLLSVIPLQLVLQLYVSVNSKIISASIQNTLIKICTALTFQSESQSISFAYTKLFNRQFGITHPSQHIISYYTVIRNVFHEQKYKHRQCCY